MTPACGPSSNGGLKESGYIVDTVADGAAAIRFLRTNDYDVAVLDWRMPEANGIQVLEDVRARNVRTPILIADGPGLPPPTGSPDSNVGADDYLVKPFDFSELLARPHRAPAPAGAHRGAARLECGDLVFDPSTRTVTQAGPGDHR